MEIRDYLKRSSDNDKKAVEQIVFAGERFDVMSVRGWRDRALGQSLPWKPSRYHRARRCSYWLEP